MIANICSAPTSGLTSRAFYSVLICFAALFCLLKVTNIVYYFSVLELCSAACGPLAVVKLQLPAYLDTTTGVSQLADQCFWAVTVW